jgi:Domain of unkown function (DUF1775)
VSFPATQTYSDGTVVHWDQPTPPGGAEAEYPAPTLALTGEPAGDEHRAPAAEGASPTNADAESTRAADNRTVVGQCQASLSPWQQWASPSGDDAHSRAATVSTRKAIHAKTSLSVFGA